ncbi:MAG: NAD(P)H-dependent oxidoreductase [Trichormus sp. ATA11-4-KO1]|jgi:FMN-dependent NADH-azoreductase|nr:NAD(P)H-dependent oxidoreductase [Trichormus sp. ATA11-4-KO1]
MNTILRIDSSSRIAGSHSRALGDYFEKAWLERNPGDHIVRRDVVAEPIEHIDAQTITGYYTSADQFTDELRSATALSDHLIKELQSANVLLITVPMYNFSVPSALKAWIDQIVRIGYTFSYDGTNFTGLVNNKRAYVICVYGAGGYTGDRPLSSFNFLEPYLKLLLSFLGIQDIRFFSVEATTADDATVAANIDQTKNEIDAVIAQA